MCYDIRDAHASVSHKRNVRSEIRTCVCDVAKCEGILPRDAHASVSTKEMFGVRFEPVSATSPNVRVYCLQY